MTHCLKAGDWPRKPLIPNIRQDNSEASSSCRGFSARILRMGAQLAPSRTQRGVSIYGKGIRSGRSCTNLVSDYRAFENGYFYENRHIRWPHGFANMKTLLESNLRSVCLVDADEQTRACYPLDFRYIVALPIKACAFKRKRRRKTILFIGEHLALISVHLVPH